MSINYACETKTLLVDFKNFINFGSKLKIAKIAVNFHILSLLELNDLWEFTLLIKTSDMVEGQRIYYKSTEKKYPSMPTYFLA